MLMRMRGLHRDEGGQSIVFVALTLLFVVLFVFMVINTGDITTKKMRSITAADSVAVSGATWMARGYNTVAMINVAMSQILAIIILIRATDRTHTIARALITIQYAIAEALSAFPITAAVGAALMVETQIIDNIENAIEEVMSPLRDALDDDGNGILWKICNAMTTMETVIVKVIPFVAQIESIRIAAVNGMTFGFIYPMIPLVDLKLPFIDDDERKFEDLCKPTHDGEVSGQGKIEHLPTTGYMGSSGVFGSILSAFALADEFGPAPLGGFNGYFKAFMPYPALRIPPPFIGLVYDGIVEATYITMCTDEVGTFTYDKQSSNCSECRSHKDDVTEVQIAYAHVASRRNISKAEDAMHRILCDPIDMDPRCALIEVIETSDGTHEIYGYYDPKVAGKDMVHDDTRLILVDNAMAAQMYLSSYGSDCKKRDKNTFTTKYYDGLYDDKTDATKRMRDKDNNVIPVEITEIKEWHIKSCKWSETEEVQEGGESEEDKPKPYLLDREKEDGVEYWQNHKDYVGITYLKSEPHVLSGRYLKNPNPLGLIYFSQAEIYVPDGVKAHLFNQCWRVRLVRFDKLSDVTGGVSSGNLGSMQSTTGESLGGGTGKFLSALQTLGGNLSDKFIIH